MAEDYAEEIMFVLERLLTLRRTTVHEIATQGTSVTNIRNLVNVQNAIDALELALLNETNRTLSAYEDWGFHS